MRTFCNKKYSYMILYCCNITALVSIAVVNERENENVVHIAENT